MKPKQTYEAAFAEIKKLVADFEEGKVYYLSPKYNEQEARRDFIDKFWWALGWDVYHNEQKDPYKQEVKVERSATGSERRRRADYAFLAPNFRDVRFYVEAKKPSVDLDNRNDYFQTVRYGWSAGTPLAVLTDFQQFRILDSRYKPDIDTVLHRCVKKYDYGDYTDSDKFSEIYYLFSREAVAGGSLERYAEALPKPSGKAHQRTLFSSAYQNIDESFLQELDEYREELARSFKNKNPNLNSAELTEVTQRTLDRLVFMRFLEDKLIEPEPLVENLGVRGNVWRDFVTTSHRLDKIYNGIIFKKHDILDSPDFKVDESTFAGIREDIAHTNSPYDFNAIPIHILGSIYERFLGKTIVATEKRARVEEKYEVRKAGGVYYTPEYIVRYIVDNTVGKLISGKKPNEVRQMRFADIACGSGSFLLGIYDLLLRHYTAYYNTKKTTRAEGVRAGCIEREDGSLQLSLWQKREILLNNIYGVDVDAQAVEVAQLSLYLKLLEDETPASAHAHQLAFHEVLLPSLDKNIVCGNSLVDWDILEGHLFEPVEERKLNPMSFENTFPEVMKKGGFDAIVGNPPYIRIQTMQETAPLAVGYYKNHYAAASKGNYDIYVVFVERALSLLNERGKLGYILPHKFFNAQYGQPLRHIISEGKHLEKVVHFGHQQVFAKATTYTALMFLSKKPTEQCLFLRVEDLEAWREVGAASEGTILASDLTDKAWNFTVGSSSPLFDKLNEVPTKLKDVTSRIFQGIKTGADKIYIVEEVEREESRVKVYSKEKETEYWLESELLHPLIKGGDSKRYHLSRTNRLILFPYYKEVDTVGLIPVATFRERYPLTWSYLLDNKKYLENRERGKMHGSGWYAYSRNQALDVMPLPKIFTPDIAPHSSFSLDETGGVFFTGGVAGGYGILALPKYSREYVLGLLNSKLLEWLIHQTATQMRGGWFSYESRFIRDLPIRVVNSTDTGDRARHDQIVQLVEQMLEARWQQASAHTDRDKTFYEKKCAAIDSKIDRLVYELYGVTDAEIELVESPASTRQIYAPTKTSQISRDRIRAAVEKMSGLRK
jgi:type I restriction-modification system DNA methylase subunit